MRTPEVPTDQAGTGKATCFEDSQGPVHILRQSEFWEEHGHCPTDADLAERRWEADGSEGTPSSGVAHHHGSGRAGRGAIGIGATKTTSVLLSLCGPALDLSSEREETARTSPGSALAEARRGPGPVNGFLLQEAPAGPRQGPRVPQNLPHVPEFAVNLPSGLDRDCPRGPEAPGPATHILVWTAAANFLAKRITAFPASWVPGLRRSTRHSLGADSAPAGVACPCLQEDLGTFGPCCV